MKRGYNLIVANDVEELQGLIEAHLNTGWQLVGGATFVEGRDKSGYGGGWAQTLYHHDLHEDSKLSR